MTNPIHQEEFNLRPIRGISRGDLPWIVAPDAATILNFDRPMEAIEALCPESLLCTVPQLGGPGIPLTIINLKDLARLASHSYLPNKAEFMAWVQGFAHRVSLHGSQPRAWVLEDTSPAPLVLRELGEGVRVAEPLISAPRSGELIPILVVQVSGSLTNAVNARDLHQFLEVGKDFSNWIKDRIEAYGFQERRDFEVFANSGDNPQGGRPAKEYALTLDMAKELSMVERNAKGKQARAYFIECERRAHQVQRVPQTLPEALRLAAELAEQRAALETRVQVLEPKAQGLDRISATEEHTCITVAAKTLGVAPQWLSTWLERNAWTYRRGRHLVPYQDKIHAGLLDHKFITITHKDKSKEDIEQTVITRKGLARLAELLHGKARA